MNSEQIFIDALEYEKRIRDMYFEAVENVDDRCGKKLFKALGDDEQSHVDFLEYSLASLKSGGTIDIERLKTAIPSSERIATHVAAMADRIEVKTSTFYRDAMEKTDGDIKKIFARFLEIENRHVDAVQVELDHATKSGFWFNFMEVDLED